MKVPTQKECFKIIKQMKMMDHIVDHSVMVCNVALFLCQKLKRINPELDENLAISAALLHDITKTRSFTTKEIHSETGCELLEDLGYPEVADIIRQHVILDEYENHSPVSEREIVNYSDKRVLHDHVVSLEHRLEYIMEKYGKKQEYRKRISIMWENTLKLENKIFKDLNVMPNGLPPLVINKITKN
ncbi:MAG: HDIG domain-containing protein [Desulfobacteraceae bacterium]|nr:HDIG domain-containing protein [Desulfobacteraceae bacterium]